jgi:hypothetical protein
MVLNRFNIPTLKDSGGVETTMIRFKGLVVASLNVNILAGFPFLINNLIVIDVFLSLSIFQVSQSTLKYTLNIKYTQVIPLMSMFQKIWFLRQNSRLTQQ